MIMHIKCTLWIGEVLVASLVYVKFAKCFNFDNCMCYLCECRRI